ncbi:MAG: flagellar biosynthesis repressor FlbT [Rhizobiales bacterium]|nr:flagellar biosynthesis repressor FlbT [Hyphomicrobiales bacterium]
MKNTLKISLKANEKIYINGAVVSVDRKTTIELLNETQFLLESHVLQPEQASTPLKQLYFILQIILMNPGNAEQARDMFRQSLPLLLDSFRNEQILSSLKHIDRLVAEGHVYDALKTIRGLYSLEDEILYGGSKSPAYQTELREIA